MKSSEELYAVNLKGEQRGSVTVYDRFFKVGSELDSIAGERTIVKEIVMAKNLINIYFEDGTRMVAYYDPQKVELFYREIKIEDGGITNN
jgi:hypothetical protein